MFAVSDFSCRVIDDHIISTIYDAVFEPARWNIVAKAFADQVGGASCFILHADSAGATVDVLSGYGLEAAGVPSYEEHYHRLDIWKSALVADRSGDLLLYHQAVPQPD